MTLLNSLKYIFLLIVLILLQVVIFNNIDFWGYANPYFYIIFVLLYPVSGNRYLLLLYAFILGISIDFLENTGGINAFATVFVAFIRQGVINIINAGKAMEEENRLYNFNFIQWTLYLVVLTFIHHFLVDFLESFKLDMLGQIALKSILGTALTLILITVYLIIFPPVRKLDY